MSSVERPASHAMVLAVSTWPALRLRRPLHVVLLLAALAALLVVGCPGPTFVVQQYGGPQRAAETIAILRVNGSAPVRLLVLDDQDVAAPIVEDGRLHIEVLPGPHTVRVANAAAPQERYAPISFVAEAGKFYRVAFAAGGEPRVYEAHRTEDTLLRDVTRPPPPVEPPPAAPS